MRKYYTNVLIGALIFISGCASNLGEKGFYRTVRDVRTENVEESRKRNEYDMQDILRDMEDRGILRGKERKVYLGEEEKRVDV